MLFRKNASTSYERVLTLRKWAITQWYLPRVMMLPPPVYCSPLKRCFRETLNLCVILVNIKGNQMLPLLVDTFPFTEKIRKIEDAVIEKNLKDILPFVHGTL